MIRRRTVVLSPEAVSDLETLYDWIAREASPEIAFNYIDRLETYVRGFDVASERGTLRADLRPGLRTVGFERRVTIAFTVTDDQALILRFFYGGQDWVSRFSETDLQ